MDGESTLLRAYSVATLEQTRKQLRTWWGRAMVASIAVVFALVSLLVGGMLVLERIQGDFFAEIVWPGHAVDWWNYPGLLVVQPWGIIALPFFPTLAMILVSYGVGLGMSVAVLIGVRMIWLRRGSLGRPTALGSATGLTPAMIALVTLGACCSTTAAATAGIGVAAQTSGTTAGALIANNWYLNVFQLVILWVALIAQEQLLVAYGIFFDRGAAAPLVPFAERFAWAKGLLRLALLVGGITWSLSMLADWTRIPPGSAGAGHWIHWVLQQQVPALLAVAVALAPAGTAHAVLRHLARPEGWLLRALLLIGGLSLILWMPPTLVSAGIAGWLNELLASLGVAAGYGSASVGPIEGWGLLFHWGLQLLLLGGFAIAVALAPARVLNFVAPHAGAAGTTPAAEATRPVAGSPAPATAGASSAEP